MRWFRRKQAKIRFDADGTVDCLTGDDDFIFYSSRNSRGRFIHKIQGTDSACNPLQFCDHSSPCVFLHKKMLYYSRFENGRGTIWRVSKGTFPYATHKVFCKCNNSSCWGKITQIDSLSVNDTLIVILEQNTIKVFEKSTGCLKRSIENFNDQKVLNEVAIDKESGLYFLYTENSNSQICVFKDPISDRRWTRLEEVLIDTHVPKITLNNYSLLFSHNKDVFFHHIKQNKKTIKYFEIGDSGNIKCFSYLEKKQFAVVLTDEEMTIWKMDFDVMFDDT